MSKFFDNKSISASELCKVFHCPAQIKVVGGRVSDMSRERFYGLRVHEETERMIRSSAAKAGRFRLNH